MRDSPDQNRPLRWRLTGSLRSGLPHPDGVGLAWLWVYLGVWVLFALYLAAIHPKRAPAFTLGYPRLERYDELWLGDHGGPATVQLAVMAVQVLMVVYLWLRFRGLRRHRRIAVGRTWSSPGSPCCCSACSRSSSRCRSSRSRACCCGRRQRACRSRIPRPRARSE